MNDQAMLKDEEIGSCENCLNSLAECVCEGSLQCPFCGTAALQGGCGSDYYSCHHLIAVTGNWGYEQYELGDLPECHLSNENLSAKWNDAELREIFGDAYSLLAAYSDGFTEPYDEEVMKRLLCEELEGTEGTLFECRGSFTELTFAPDPDAVRTRIGEFFHRLEQGFDRLAMTVDV